MKILKHFLPPIFNRNYIKKYFNLIYNRKKTIHKFKYEKNFYKRVAFINKAISKYNDCKYLEIGVSTNKVFNSIPLKMSNKFGVDPNQGGNFRMTSDEFFIKYKDLKFDVIFIDGLHHYEQCQKDCINSINQLKENGIILFHDMLPRCEMEQVIPQSFHTWTGDVWKVAVELSHSKNMDFRICNIDHGIGILKLLKNHIYTKIPELNEKKFQDFLEYKKNFKIINSEEALDFIEQS
tara:strand:- start:7540 stop:8247 length:708 start_codon:yes stop_codon:yes gene_type:complete